MHPQCRTSVMGKKDIKYDGDTIIQYKTSIQFNTGVSSVSVHRILTLAKTFIT